MYDIKEQVLKVLQLYPETNELQAELQLEIARNFINDRRGYTPTEEAPIESRYESLQVLMAVEALSKEGAEGEVSHSDNGTSRGYENGSPYSTTLLNMIIPLGTSFKA